MADLKSEQYGFLQMTPEEQMENILEARARRRKRQKPQTAASKRKTKKLLAELPLEQLQELVARVGR